MIGIFLSFILEKIHLMTQFANVYKCHLREMIQIDNMYRILPAEKVLFILP